MTAPTGPDAPAPLEPPRRRPRLSARARLAIVGVVAATVLGAFAVQGLQDNLVYYRTPSEVAASGTERVRLGGLVLDGTIRRDGNTLHFTVTDGVTDVPVLYSGSTTGVFREGQGAIVEGTLRDGTFTADSLLVKHDNQYVSDDGTTYDGDRFAPGQ